MQIEYVTNKAKRTVSDIVGRALIARKIARVVETKQVIPEDTETKKELATVVEAPAKAKRRYKRRDMKAEQ